MELPGRMGGGAPCGADPEFCRPGSVGACRSFGGQTQRARQARQSRGSLRWNPVSREGERGRGSRGAGGGNGVVRSHKSFVMKPSAQGVRPEREEPAAHV